MADYSQIERELINKNKQYGEQQAQSMRDNANSWINDLNSAIDAAARRGHGKFQGRCRQPVQIGL